LFLATHHTREQRIYNLSSNILPSKMSDNQPSTLNSYVNSAIGGAQELLGSLTGNTVDQVSKEDFSLATCSHYSQKQGEAKQQSAQAENDLSHTAAKAGPFTVSSSGAVAQDSKDRSQGSWDQTVGAAKEAVGGLVGAEGLRQSGIEQNKQGKAQEAQGQLNDLGKGLTDRASGAVGGALAGLTGNAGAQAEYQKQHDTGKTLQRGVEADLQKAVDAQDTTKET
jgi:uncharacterized protein YjbJ (UPF0337 family)